MAWCLVNIIFTLMVNRVIRGIQAQHAAEKKVKIFQGILPICSHCKNIRKEDGFWVQMEHYVQNHSEADFSHGICLDCMQKHYDEFVDG